MSSIWKLFALTALMLANSIGSAALTQIDCHLLPLLEGGCCSEQEASCCSDGADQCCFEDVPDEQPAVAVAHGKLSHPGALARTVADSPVTAPKLPVVSVQRDVRAPPKLSVKERIALLEKRLI